VTPESADFLPYLTQTSLVPHAAGPAEAAGSTDVTEPTGATGPAEVSGPTEAAGPADVAGPVDVAGLAGPPGEADAVMPWPAAARRPWCPDGAGGGRAPPAPDTRRTP